jgi:ankyrin repeat protein
MGIRSCSRHIVPLHNSHSQSKENNLGGDFYWACRNGDLEMVKNIYEQLTYDQLNEIQPNGSTALHAACSGNHPHIVKFLLDNGCSRTILNNQNKIAYDIAATDKIQRLFD